MHKYLILKLIISLSFFLFTCKNNENSTKKAALPEKKSEISLALSVVDTTINLDYLMGHFDPQTHPNFTKIPVEYTDGDGAYYLRKDTWAAFKKMADAAQKDGVKLVIRSATRNFNRQKQIWEGKWKGNRKIENGKNAAISYPDPKTRALKILEYSSMPSTSRHHWGTDMDLNNFTNEYFEAGTGKKIYDWLQTYGAEYGFCQPYTAKGEERPDGYNEEKWHWSYMPVAKKLLSLARKQFSDTGIKGFWGAETAVEIGVVEKYVLGVNKACY